MKHYRNTLRYLSWTIAILAITSQAHATSNIECTGINSDADVSILMGAGPVPNALEASVSLGKRYITTYQHQDGEHGTIVQFYATKHEISLDMMDNQAETLIASVRILKYENQDSDEIEAIQIGYLRVNGAAPVGITCDGP